jgi:hypothetical protein
MPSSTTRTNKRKMRTTTSTLLSLLSLSSSILVGNVRAQDDGEDASVWYTQGAQSFYWVSAVSLSSLMLCSCSAVLCERRPTACLLQFIHAPASRNTEQPTTTIQTCQVRENENKADHFYVILYTFMHSSCCYSSFKLSLLHDHLHHTTPLHSTINQRPAIFQNLGKTWSILSHQTISTIHTYKRTTR